MHELSEQDARDSFSNMLNRVDAGEHFVITRAGRPIAEVMPVERARRSFDDIVRSMDERKTHCRLDGLRWAELRDEGRR